MCVCIYMFIYVCIYIYSISVQTDNTSLCLPVMYAHRHAHIHTIMYGVFRRALFPALHTQIHACTHTCNYVLVRSAGLMDYSLIVGCLTEKLPADGSLPSFPQGVFAFVFNPFACVFVVSTHVCLCVCVICTRSFF